jgi:hypothetical protein
MRPHTLGARSRVVIPLAVVLGLVVACNRGGRTSGDPSPGDAGAVDPLVPAIGATEFVSADPGSESGGMRGPAVMEMAESERASDDSSARTVEEGDIYRTLGDGALLNFNVWRGLQVIDIADPDAPAIRGELRLQGAPVEMYVMGDRALLLLNGWRSPTSDGDDGEEPAMDRIMDAGEGMAVALLVDVSDQATPRIVDSAELQGHIRTSRLVSGEGGAALYVASASNDQRALPNGTTEWRPTTLVHSFAVAAEGLTPVSRLDLGGYVADIHATPEALLVARTRWDHQERFSRVAVVDIGDPGGAMRELGEVRVKGFVQSQFNMDLRDDVLRVVTEGATGDGPTNHLETFRLPALEPLSHCEFGSGQNLFATIFLGDRAFFVTYFRVDPFHAFALGTDGSCDERAEFVVSGWNDFFRAVRDETRLIGIGVDDDDEQRTLAVSLYDITDLDDPEPLLARAHVESTSSWSEASWDHRAFSVLEDAVSVRAPDGTRETGLVLLPFSGYDAGTRTHRNGVQLFSFSGSTLTRRGYMEHGDAVRRTFPADDALVANLGDASLGLYGIDDPDAPQQRGSLVLAPDYTDVLRFGAYRARVIAPSDAGRWDETATSIVELVHQDQDMDRGPAVARFEVKTGATLHHHGDLLVAVHMVPRPSETHAPDHQTTIAVWDLSDPTDPQLARTIETDLLRPAGGGWFEPFIADCIGCGRGIRPAGPSRPDVVSVDGGLVFLGRKPHSEVLGTERFCSYWSDDEGCWPEHVVEQPCTFVSGGMNCVSFEGGDDVCTGAFERCTLEDNVTTCERISVEDVDFAPRCYEQERIRHWESMELVGLDLRTPEEATLSPMLGLPQQDEAVGIVADGNTAWVSFKRPLVRDGDARSFAQYFAQPIDFTNPAAPGAGDAVNVPGELVAARGLSLVTRDPLWSESALESAVARVRVGASGATLEAIRRFEGREVDQVRVDRDGTVVVTHRMEWERFNREGESIENELKLSVLDAETLAERAARPLRGWATLRDLVDGLALFDVGGGLLVLDIRTDEDRFDETFHPTYGWSQSVRIAGDRLLVASGRYGISVFPLRDAETVPSR